MASTTDANTDDPAWPTAFPDPSEVRAWIASVLRGEGVPAPTVAGPVEIYQENGRSVTARFAVADPWWASGVVFHASPRVIYAYTPAVYRLLMPHVPDRVPQLVAWTEHRDQVWTLFRTFAGEKLSTVLSLGALKDLARLMARIQVAVAGLPGDGLGEIPHLPVGRLPALFDEIIADIRDVHLTAWKADGEAVRRRFGLPADPLIALTAYRPHVAAWARELKVGGWPETINHDDLQGDNAVRLHDGRLLLYDWEGATIGCPFFSLDRLLDDARALDRPRERSQTGDILGEVAEPSDAGTALVGSPTERAVRDAYLNALPWGTPEARDRAFTVALCLAPLHAAYVTKVHTLALQRVEAFSLLTAVCISRALHRWQSMRAKDRSSRGLDADG